MNWEALQTITEVLGLLAVIASLLYIGVQTKQSNDHATAASEVEWFHAWNQILNSWVSDERTTLILQKGFSSFDSLTNADQALFHMRIGSMVNQWLLAQKLKERKLFSTDFARDSTKVLLAVLTTQGGYEYIQHDWKLFPGGKEIMDMVERNRGNSPDLTEILPWWREEQ